MKKNSDQPSAYVRSVPLPISATRCQPHSSTLNLPVVPQPEGSAPLRFLHHLSPSPFQNLSTLHISVLLATGHLASYIILPPFPGTPGQEGPLG